MKRKLAMLFAGLFLAAHAASAAPLTKAERDALINHLKKTEKMLKDATKGLSLAQWKYKSAADRWSVEDCLEHLTLSEDFLFKRIQDNVMKAPATAVDPAAAKEGDDFILKVIPDRSNRAQAPEPLKPTGQWKTPQDMLKEFSARRKRTIDYVRTTQDDLRAHKVDAPMRKGMDGYQWLLLISAHTERHTAQAIEVKQDANFPKK